MGIEMTEQHRDLHTIAHSAETEQPGLSGFRLSAALTNKHNKDSCCPAV